MDRHAIFVDAGYFFAAGAQAAFNSKTPRKNITLKDSEKLITALRKKTSEITDGLPLLRAYWYDAMPGPRLSLEQSGIAKLNWIKLRLGALNSAGEQKGVDSLIVTDLIDLARNRAVADMVLISGDEDLRIAVQIAQSFGVRVHILAAGDPTKNVSPALQMEADSVNSLDSVWFQQHFELTSPVVAVAPSSTPAKLSAPTSSSTIDQASISATNQILDSLTQDKVLLLKSHFESSTSIPPEYDRKFIAKVSEALSGKQLTGDEMRHARGVFVKGVRLKASPDL